MKKIITQHIPEFSIILIKAFTTPLMIYFVVAGNIIMFVSAYVFFYVEKGVNVQIASYLDALWWALCTVSTVGYGDIYPVTGAGRCVAAFLIVTGVMFYLGSMAVLSSIVTSLTAQRMNNT